MLREFLVGQHVGESVFELITSMICESVCHKGEHAHSWDGVCPPMSVKILLNVLMENTISTFNGISLDSFSEISRFLGETLKNIWFRPSIRLIES